MAILLTFLLSASYSTALPAACIADLGPQPLRPEPAWRSLLPSVVVGVDHGAYGDLGFGLDARRSQSLSPFRDDGAVHHRDERRLTRWVIALRWQKKSQQDPIAPLPGDDITGHCHALAELLARRPAGLPALIDHTTESARLRALIDDTSTREE